jgi:hypothetical protein
MQHNPALRTDPKGSSRFAPFTFLEMSKNSKYRAYSVC